MGGAAPTIWWIRRDMRLDDNPALQAALDTGRPVIPVAILDPLTERLGAAPLWRWGLGLRRFAETLETMGARLILRRGDALETLQALITETGAATVVWTRAYDAASVGRDARIKSALKEDGIDAVSTAGHLLFEPWTVETKTGGYYKVFTPMWKAVRGTDLPEPAAPPSRWPAPGAWPASDRLEDWGTGRAMNRGAEIVRAHQILGEAAARDRLDWFMAEAVADYDAGRDIPGRDGTSRLSANLALGEIGPRRCWHAGLKARAEGKPGAETFLKELVWREFAYHLLWHTPHIADRNWREDWDAFPWNEDETAEVTRWKQGLTGIRFVDAAMREMYVTGTMHNRGRMIVASYLTKHLMTHWRIGQRWFEDCLTDWDPASNALGWQWSAGCGPDATPYFRVFNPETQLDKFDRDRTYTRAWIAEGQGHPPATALAYFDAVPRSWGLKPDDPYPDPVVDAATGRQRALDAYESRTF